MTPRFIHIYSKAVEELKLTYVHATGWNFQQFNDICKLQY